MNTLILVSFLVGSLILFATSRPCAEMLGRIGSVNVYGLIGIQVLCLLSYVGLAAHVSLSIASDNEIRLIPLYVITLAVCIAFGIGSIRRSIEVKRRIASTEVKDVT